MTTSRMKLVFLGSGEFGIPTLAALTQHHDVAMVVSQPDRPAGRGGKLTPTPISAYAQEHLAEVPLLKPQNINEPDITAQVRAVNADAWVVIAFGQKLGKPLLDGIFAVNLHGSILPRWRGAAPINWAVIEGDPLVGNSAITLADRMDAGLVLGTTSRPLEPQWTAGELHDILSADGPDLILSVLAKHAARTLSGDPQDESKVTKALKLGRQHGWVDFTRTAEHCRRWIHGMTPWPGVKAEISGSRVKLLRTQVAAQSHNDRAPGTLLNTDGMIACGDNTILQLLELQPEGKKPMTWAAYCNGYRPALEQIITSVREDPA